MKIIHCLNHFLPDSVAGTEVYTRGLVNELLLKDIEALVLIPNYGKSSNETYQYENIRVLQFAEPSVESRDLIMGKVVPGGLTHFKKIIILEKPSVIHFHIVGGSNGFSLHHLRAAKEMGIKVVMTFHLAGYTCKTGNLMFKNQEPCNGVINAEKCTWCVYTSREMGILKKNVLYAAAVIAHKMQVDATKLNNSIGTAIGFPFLIDDLKSKLLQLSGVCDKMVVLSGWYKKVLELNGIPAHKLVHVGQGVPGRYKYEKVDKQDGILKLIFVGRVHETKGLHLLISALSKLPHNRITLHVYGKTTDSDYAVECIKSAEQMKNIYWKGQLSPDLVAATLGHFDCLCVPSVICEMSPLVIQEAFAAGIPVLASNVYGNAEQIKNGENGWLFNFNDSIDLKNKIQMLSNNPEIIRQAVAKIQPVKSFAAVADEYENVYKDVLAAS